MQRSKRIIGVSEQHRRHGEAQRLGRFEVDQQVEFDGQLDRQIGRVGAPEMRSMYPAACWNGSVRSSP
jgi:hypothetical protein